MVISHNVQPQPRDMRRVAEQVLDVLAIPIRHASLAVTGKHGHGGLCCCITQQCRGRDDGDQGCNLNPVLVVLAESRAWNTP